MDSEVEIPMNSFPFLTFVGVTSSDENFVVSIKFEEMDGDDEKTPKLMLNAL